MASESPRDSLETEPGSTRPTTMPPPPPPSKRHRTGWSPLIIIALFGLSITLGWFIRSTGGLEATVRRVKAAVAGAPSAAQSDLELEPIETETEAPTASAPAPRADANFKRTGKSTIMRGIMVIPPAFSSEDGTYDLVIHFHGNTDLVAEGMSLTGLNAIVVIFNLGTGSRIYEQNFQNPSRFKDVLNHVQADLRSRGLETPHLGRLAVSAWSAGYGAVQGILSVPELVDRIDAVVMLDGMHGAYRGLPPAPDDAAGLLHGEIEPVSLAPFVAFAERAVKGEKLFVLVHSNIEPIGYVGVARSADFLLEKVHVERAPAHKKVPMPAYKSLEGIWPVGEMVSLVQKTEAKQGGLVIRGYGGSQPAQHIAHLVQFPETAMPFLVERWKR